MDAGSLELCAPLEPPRSVATAEGRVWFVTNNGRLLSFDPTFTSMREERSGGIERVHTAVDGALLALTGHTVLRFHAGVWTPPIVMNIPAGQSVLGFSDVNGRPIVTSGTDLYIARSDGATVTKHVPSEGERDRGRLTVGAARGEDIYVGSWLATMGGIGGGMFRVRQVSDRDQTDPPPLGGITAHGWAVTVVTADPARSDCVYFATAANDVAKGRIGDICAGIGETLFEDGDEYFTLLTTGKSLLAIGDTHAHILNTAGKPTQTLPLPLKTERHCGAELAGVGDYWAFPTGSRIYWQYLATPKP